MLAETITVIFEIITFLTKTFQDGNGNANFEKINSNDFRKFVYVLFLSLTSQRAKGGQVHELCRKASGRGRGREPFPLSGLEIL